jgi:acyl-CoA thioester hydrolase
MQPFPYLTPLPVGTLRAAGVPAPWTFGHADRVRFYELDALGHVNNTVYLKWFETQRVRWFGDRGMGQLRPEDPTFVIRSLTCEFLAPMFLDQEYIVTARCESFRRTSLTKTYAIWSGGRPCATGAAVIVMTDRTGAEKVPLTDDQRQMLTDRDGARDDR